MTSAAGIWTLSGPHTQPEPVVGPNHLLVDGLFALRWSSECRYYRVPNKFGPLPTHPFHAFQLCASDFGGEGLPRAVIRGGDHNERVRACIDDGQVRPSPR